MINPPKPLSIVLDTDIGNGPDGLLALCMILDRTDKIDLCGVICTGKSAGLKVCLVRHILEICGRKDSVGRISEVSSLLGEIMVLMPTHPDANRLKKLIDKND